jgi:hypothetical protein
MLAAIAVCAIVHTSCRNQHSGRKRSFATMRTNIIALAEYPSRTEF